MGKHGSEVETGIDESASGSETARSITRAAFLGAASAGALLPLLGSVDHETALAEGSRSTQRSKNLTFYLVSHVGPGNSFMEAESKGVAAAGKDLGVRAIFTGPTTPNSESEQLQLLRSAIATNPAGIAFSLFSPGPSTNLVKEMHSKGIAVVLWNIQTLGTASSAEKSLAYVGQDEQRSGAKNAKHLLTHLKHGETVLIVTAFQGFPLTVRRSGATNVLKAHGHDVKFLYTGQDIPHGQGLIDAYVARNHDVKAYMALDAISATSVGKYLKTSGKAKSHPPFSSFDLSPITLDYIKNGLLTFTLDQQPFAQGYAAIVDLFLAKRYGMSPSDINTGTLFIDKSNAHAMTGLVKQGIGA